MELNVKYRWYTTGLHGEARERKNEYTRAFEMQMSKDSHEIALSFPLLLLGMVPR